MLVPSIPHPVQSIPPDITILLLQRSRLSSPNCISDIIQVSSPLPSIGQLFHNSRTIALKMNRTSEKGRLGSEKFVHTLRGPRIRDGSRAVRCAYTSPRRLYVYLQYCFRLSEAAAITMPAIAKRVRVRPVWGVVCLLVLRFLFLSCFYSDSSVHISFFFAPFP